jgi:hypothetical protein
MSKPIKNTKVLNQGEKMNKAHLTQTRLIMIQCFLTVVLAFSFTDAHAQRNGGNGHGNQGQGGYNNQPQVLKAQIFKQLQGYSKLAVKSLVKNATGARLQGLKVKKVILKASSRRGHAQATLLVNGMRVGYSQTIPTYETRLVFDLNSWSQNVIGQDVRTIQIEINGNVLAKMVGLKVKQNQSGGQGQGGYNQNVVVNVNQAFYGSQRVSLSQLTAYGPNINPNKAIEAVTITARGRGMIQVAGSGHRQGGVQVQGPTTQSIRVFGHTTVRDLMLRITATGQKVVIEQIRIKFKRGNGY